MKVVLQRVLEASVTINGNINGQINDGLLILLGIEDADTKEDIDWLCNKIVNLRIFDDENGVMNKSILETGGGMLVVSQFTLMASTKKGNRPSYIKASKPEIAIPIYNSFLTQLSSIFAHPIATGVFGANMQVSLVNNGPVTIIIDTKNKE
jgi:D-aminoacyl-tRNA deacylase